MDLATILADAQMAISVAKLAIQLGQDAAPYIENAYNILFNGKQLTADERSAMSNQELAWRGDIDAAVAKDPAV